MSESTNTQLSTNSVLTKMATNEAYANRTSETLRDVVADIIFLLKQAGQTVAVAESLTAGSVMAAITSVGGASSVFRGGVVSYATDLKRRLLNVDGSLIDREGVIHGEVARQMAIGARKIATTDTAQPTSWGVSTTGVAGPDLQDGKAVGTVFIGIASQHQTWALGPFNFPGDREQIRQATVLEALSQLRELLRTQRADVQL